jgi:tetratricopeptide (TPR) repeat protein
LSELPKSKIQSLIIKALELHGSNNIDSAKKIYEEILASYPTHFDSSYLMGMIAIGESDFISAKKFLTQSLKILPSHAEAHFNLGVVFEQLADTTSALNHYSAAIKIKDDFIEAINNRATLRGNLSLWHEALEDLELLLKIKPDMVTAQVSKNSIINRLSLISNNLNTAKSEVADVEAKLFIDLHETGFKFLNAGKYQLALDSFDKALLIYPKRPDALHNKGLALERLGRLNEALENYEKAIIGAPESAPTLNNMGNVLRELGQYERSISFLEKAIEVNPSYSEAFSNLGWTLYTIRQFEGAISAYKKALSFNPNLTEALFNLSLSNLMLGDFENGWLNYEHRKSQPFYSGRKFSKPSWTGSESLTDKSIFVYSEQGLGDTIQFCRYAKLLSDQGAKVLFEPQPALKNLLANLDGVSKIVTLSINESEYDYQCSLMSLPLAFKTSASTIPNQIPYIKPEIKKVSSWSRKLNDIKGPKVGLVWSGGFRPNQPELWAVNERRNISFPKISNLNIEGIQFFSLQKGEKAELELREAKDHFWKTTNFWDFTNELHDFSDTAALIECLDLVISVDTSTAHLAAALGKPTWILNRFDNCWRWLADGENSAWYPTAKLYRQEKMGIWEDVLFKVKDDLIKYF